MEEYFMMNHPNIKEIVNLLGIPSTYVGLRYLTFSVSLAVQDEDSLLFVTKRIYPVVASKYQTSAACVERNLRTVINVCWDRGNRLFLNTIAGYAVSHKPSAGEFIAMITAYIKRRQPSGAQFDT